MSWTDIDAQMAIGMVWKAQDVHTEDSEILREVRMNRYEMTGKEMYFVEMQRELSLFTPLTGTPIQNLTSSLLSVRAQLDYRTDFPVPFLFQRTKHHTREKKILLFE